MIEVMDGKLRYQIWHVGVDYNEETDEDYLLASVVHTVDSLYEANEWIYQQYGPSGCSCEIHEYIEEDV